MSIRLMSIVWDIPWPSQSALLIALKLADYANDEGGSIHPARETLSKHAQTSLATTKRVLAAFRDVGLLRVVSEGGKGRGKTTKYEFDLKQLMRLHDGYDELERHESEPERFVIVVKSPVDACGQVEAQADPLNPLRGSLESFRGSLGKINGSIDEPRTTNLDPPIRTTIAHAREVDKSGFEKNGRPLPAMRLTSKDVSWRKWIDHLRLNGEGDLADAAEAAGEMIVCKRWPEPDTPLPKVNMRPIVAKQLADRVVGEGA